MIEPPGFENRLKVGGSPSSALYEVGRDCQRSMTCSPNTDALALTGGAELRGPDARGAARRASFREDFLQQQNKRIAGDPEPVARAAKARSRQGKSMS